MKNMSEKIDQYFKRQFEQYEELPPETAWKNISAKLRHNRKKGIAVLFFRIAAGMALLFSLGIGYYLISKPDNPVDAPALTVSKNTDVEDGFSIKPSEVDQERTALKPVKKTRIRSSRKAGPADDPELSTPVYVSYSDAVNNPEALQPLGQGLIPVDLPGSLPFKSLSSSSIAIYEDIAALLAESETEAEPDPLKQGRWSLGGEFAPLYSNRTISSDNLEADQVSSLNDSETGMLAYAGGLRLAFSKGRRLSVQTGIYYSRYGQEKNQIETFSYSNTEVTAGETNRATYLAVTNSTGVIYSNNPENASYSQAITNNSDSYKSNNAFAVLNGFNSTYLTPSEENDISVEQLFDYLEIPLTVKYKIIDRKFDFSLSGGLVTNLLVNNVVNLEQNGEKTRFGKTDEINQVNYIGSFGLGFEYPLVSGFALSLEPRFRYYLNPIDKSAYVHPYSFGFFAGISYNF
ncbi:MAG: outer membrane beta-barrel protein [Bacteroidales bacterium]|nr:outer membrane beta-barrel protein [Bacteroidales bacterium]